MLFQIIFECAYLLFSPLLIFAGLFTDKKKIISYKKEHKTVLIIHGYLTRGVLHFFLKRYLEKNDLTVFTPSFGFHTEKADILAEKLAKYVEDKKLDQFILIGTSYGACICLNYLQKFNGWDKTKHFIGLAGPYHGTYRILSPVYREKIASSRILNPDRVTCVSAKYDELVPRWSSQLSGVKNITVPVIGHAYLCSLSEGVRQLILDKANNPAN